MIEDRKKLLENKGVIEEINRHLWLESEKAGYDIGFEKAAEDWLNRFSDAWLKHHMPQQAGEKKTRTKRTTVLKTRRASSYV